mmetsp:Transcript_6814/g.7050  ORF Transcript_6814/g.7050 Transcript_6814/m.7050 type:complete len:467 (-) Transcript_6814:248-1648(-)|eukprot:CAMPEP_0182429904 /NCGR_PEP_ID=MMETSP1167-20130531/34899_1 /TAXON_ID=2988 /ORGANISM="Mallomonas Sp, Strain CCMP3275" /LENGTH=466 /DNA_ID=CAMNT_0024614287 /DNA_START=106 /DNA_END=1509 /DNA_ORIENTATION=+
MGAGAAALKPGELPLFGNSQQQEHINAIEDFTEMAYLNGSKMDGLKLILTNLGAREAFTKFLNKETSAINFFDEVEKLLSSAGKSGNAIAAKAVTDRYEKPIENPEDTAKPQEMVSTDVSATTLASSSLPASTSESPSKDLQVAKITSEVEVYDNICTFIEIQNKKSLQIRHDGEVGVGTVLEPLAEIDQENEEDPETSGESGSISSSTTETPADAIYNATNETIVLLALSLFPKFIGSQEYRDWREAEKKQVMVEGGQADSSFTRSLLSPVKNKNKNVEVDIGSKSESQTLANSFASKCVKHLDPLEVDRIFGSGSWLATFVSAAEGLPICVSVADADLCRPNFPLLYVNGVFENTTGYARSDIVGRNCRFLQGDKTERYSVMKISHALQNRLSTRVSITNYRKDGTTFLNLLAIKPVFDMDGKYCYVVAVQFDGSVSGHKHMMMIQLADKLIEIIPDVIPYGGY